MSGLLTFLGGAAGTAGSIVGQSMANDSNERLNAINRQHERELLYMQQDYAEQQAEKADERTRALYTDLQSPEAIRKQLENAGLSIGMMYGQGGAGGSMQAGAQAESPTAQNRGTIPMQNIMDAQTMMMLANAEKAKAETQNIEEDTNKKKAETKVTWKDLDMKDKQLMVMDWSIENTKKGIEKQNKEIEEIGQRILNSIADTNLKENQAELAKAQKELQKALKEWQDAQTNLTNIDLKYRDGWNQAQINEWKANAYQSYKAGKSMEELANKYHAEAAGQELQNSLNKYTYLDQAKQIIYNAARAQMEAGTFMMGKIVEWKEAQARIDKLIEETIEIGWSNRAYEDAKAIFGEAGAGYFKEVVEIAKGITKGQPK